MDHKILEFTIDKTNQNVQRAFEYFYDNFFEHVAEADDLNFWIAGGCFRDFFAGKFVTKDYDVFFKSEKDLIDFSKRFLDGWTVVVENDNVVKMIGSFTDPYNESGENSKHTITIDLIKKYFDGPKHTISEFDFTVACCAMTLGKMYCTENFLFDLATRKLTINKLPYPIATQRRLSKYIRKGFLPCQGTLLEIGKALTHMKETDFIEPSKLYFD